MAKLKEISFKIDGMHCAGCVSNIEKNLSRLDGVKDCKVNLAMSNAVISYEDAKTDQSRIFDKVEELGYKATIGDADLLTSNRKEEKSARSNFRLSLIITIPLMIIVMLSMITGKQLINFAVDGKIDKLFSGDH